MMRKMGLLLLSLIIPFGGMRESRAQPLRIASDGDCPTAAQLQTALLEFNVEVGPDADILLSIQSDEGSATLTITAPEQGERTRTIVSSDCSAIAELFAIISSQIIGEFSAQSAPVATAIPEGHQPENTTTRMSSAVADTQFPSSSEVPNIAPQLGLRADTQPNATLSLGALIGVSTSREFADSPGVLLVDLSLKRSKIALSATLWLSQSANIGTDLETQIGGSSLEAGYPIQRGTLWIQPSLGLGVQISKISSSLPTRNAPLRLHPALVASLSGKFAITSRLALRTDLRFHVLPLVDRYNGANGEIGTSPRTLSMIAMGLQWGIP